MPRTLNATLEAALDARNFTKPIIRGWLGVDSALDLEVQVIKYKLERNKITATIYASNLNLFDLGYNTFNIERGLEISNTEYTIVSNGFTIKSARYQNGLFVIQADLINDNAYQASGDVTYKTVITAWMAEAANAAPIFQNSGATWLDYQFLPAGKQILLNRNTTFEGTLHQKYLIFLADHSKNNVYVFSADGLSARAVDHTITPNDLDAIDQSLSVKKFHWVDQNGTYNESTTANATAHNLGYLESTADPPSETLMFMIGSKITLPFHLKYLSGDKVNLLSRSILIHVTEILDPAADIAWRLEITPIEFLSNSEGGALPSTIERISNYTPLNTSGFDGILSKKNNNLQAAMDTLDDHDHNRLATSAGIQAMIDKTLIETPKSKGLKVYENTNFM